jgi:DNA-binding NtrC family response regulator
MGRSNTRKQLLIIDGCDELELLAHKMEASRLFQVTRMRSIKAARSHKYLAKLDLIFVHFDDTLIGANSVTDGLAVTNELIDWMPNCLLTIFANQPNTNEAVACLQAGAIDYIECPFAIPKVIAKLKSRVFAKAHGKRAVKISDGLAAQSQTVDLSVHMGSSSIIQSLIAEIKLVAQTEFTVHVIGETGTGKEMIAQAIHDYSPRSNETFKPFDCGAIPEALFESMLFGHEKGAFTGAQKSGTGFFRAAARGTLFLDEISSMDLRSQGKLLRVLQEKSFYRVGSSHEDEANIRFVSAANKELGPAEPDSGFRSDLYFRLSEYVIHAPALRDRLEDIPHLVSRFVDFTAEELGVEALALTEEALERLQEWHWPGNVRELRNMTRRAMLLAGLRDHSDCLGVEYFQFSTHGQKSDGNGTKRPSSRVHLKFGESLRELVKRSRIDVEKRALREVLEASEGNIAEVARQLQADYKTIHSKLKDYGICL